MKETDHSDFNRYLRNEGDLVRFEVAFIDGGGGIGANPSTVLVSPMLKSLTQR